MKFNYTITLLFICSSIFSQVDNYSKNKGILDSLNSIYKLELLKDSTSAIPHWNHAKRLEKVTFNAEKNAPKYYNIALNIDSTNAEIYKDYGNYFLRHEQFKYAYFLFKQGQMYNEKDSYFTEKLIEIKLKIQQEEKYWELHKLPVYNPIEKPKTDFKKLIDYNRIDSLIEKGQYAYDKLSTAFYENPALLNNKEMFYLILGQSNQAYFKPYNFDDEEKIQQLTWANRIDEAISFGEKIILIEPLNIIVLRELIFCYRIKGNVKKSKNAEIKLSKIFNGFMYSGDGSKDKPIVTLSTQEEYIIARYMGYDNVKYNGTTTNSNNLFLDKMVVSKQNGEKKILYFNFTPIYFKM